MQRKNIFFLAFLEGSAAMAAELCGAKMLAPVFGTSLFVWASVIGITLFALMCGYFTGGYVSDKIKSIHLVYWVLLFAGSYLILMPYIGSFILRYTIYLDLIFGTIISLMVFLFPCLVFMGASTPIIIRKATELTPMPGKNAGSVYAISTMGGIAGTFLTGFLILPDYGIKITTLFFGVILVAIPLIRLLKNKKLPALIILLAIILILLKPIPTSSQKIKVIYQAEGILGQLKVVDQYYFIEKKGWVPGRGLLVNNTLQSVMDLQHPMNDLWEYSKLFSEAASSYPPGSKVLLLGMGGGSLIKQFQEMKFKVDVVEIDKRIKETGIKYFYINPATNIIIDDARHFINQTDNKYDIITYDLFLSETPPAHLFTLECFNRVKEKMKSNGLLMINFYGFISGKLGKPSRSILKTLKASGFYVQTLATPGDNELNRNLIFLAGKTPLPVQKNTRKYILDIKNVDFSKVNILTDNRSDLENQYIAPALKWREEMNKTYAKMLMHEGLPVFK